MELDRVLMPLHLVNGRSHLIQAKCRTAYRNLAFGGLECLKYKWMGQAQALFPKELITRDPLTTLKVFAAGAGKAIFVGNWGICCWGLNTSFKHQGDTKECCGFKRGRKSEIFFLAAKPEETDGSAGNNLSSVELYSQPEQFDKMIHCVLNLQIQAV